MNDYVSGGARPLTKSHWKLNSHNSYINALSIGFVFERSYAYKKCNLITNVQIGSEPYAGEAGRFSDFFYNIQNSCVGRPCTGGEGDTVNSRPLHPVGMHRRPATRRAAVVSGTGGEGKNQSGGREGLPGGLGTVARKEKNEGPA